MNDIVYRKDVARRLLSDGIDELDLQLSPDLTVAPQAGLTADLAIPFPAGLGPTPEPPDHSLDPAAPLPHADVLVVVWTVAEQNGLADVLTPGFARKRWHRYTRAFDTEYAPYIRPGAPALAGRRLGSWFASSVGNRSVLCFKSELHLNQDGIATGEGTATLPVREMWAQLIDEVQPDVIITTGTSGAVYAEHGIGDVVITRAAKFRLSDEFAKEPFNGVVYRSTWDIPRGRLPDAQKLMAPFASRLVEPAFGPPTKRYPFPGPLVKAAENSPAIRLDGVDLPEFHPILTTDYFEFGTSANSLDEQGVAVEMGDAVLGLECSERGDSPDWVVVRNISDPQINGDLPIGPGPLNMQTHWAVWYYEAFGYWTSVTGALAVWGVVAGLAER